MLLPNTLASSAPTITLIDAIKALYKHKSPIRRSFGVKGSQVLIMFGDVNYWYVPLAEKTHKGRTVMLLTEIVLTNVVRKLFFPRDELYGFA